MKWYVVLLVLGVVVAVFSVARIIRQTRHRRAGETFASPGDASDGGHYHHHYDGSHHGSDGGHDGGGGHH